MDQLQEGIAQGGQRLLSLSHKELVHRHRCIDGHFASCQGIKVDLLHAVRRLVREELRQTLNPHA